jgi:hypothetical protein
VNKVLFLSVSEFLDRLTNSIKVFFSEVNHFSFFKLSF